MPFSTEAFSLHLGNMTCSLTDVHSCKFILICKILSRLFNHPQTSLRHVSHQSKWDWGKRLVKSYEVLARRYCALLGEDPDETIEGIPAWRFALVDLEAAIHALHTFGIDAEAPLRDQETEPTASFPARHSTEDGAGAANVLRFRKVA